MVSKLVSQIHYYWIESSIFIGWPIFVTLCHILPMVNKADKYLLTIHLYNSIETKIKSNTKYLQTAVDVWTKNNIMAENTFMNIWSKKKQKNYSKF